MEHVIPYFILEYLDRYQSLEVPDLGRFDRVLHPAQILSDKTISPPFSESNFVATGSESHGLFHAYVKFLTGRPEAVVALALKSFVDQIHQTLQKSGNCVVRGFGEFFFDDQKKIGFSPDKEAFNREFFGFKPIPFILPVELPRLTTAPAPIMDADNMGKNNVAKAIDEGIGKTKQRRRIPLFIPFAVVLFMLVTAFAYWQYRAQTAPDSSAFFNRKPEFDSAFTAFADKTEDKSTNTIEEPDLNTSMAVDSLMEKGFSPDHTGEQINLEEARNGDVDVTFPDKPELEESTSSATLESDPEAETKENLNRTEEDVTREGESYNASTSARPSCQIIVGAFRMESNVSRMKEKLQLMGMNCYLEPAGGLTRIGIIPQSCARDIVDQTLQRVRSEIEKDAWILKSEPG